MFIKTKTILEASESALLGFSTSRHLLSPMQRLFFYPLVYLKVGFGDFTRPMAVWSFTSFVLLILLAILSSNVELPREAFLIFFNVSMWGVLLLITFLTPSTYAFYGATDASVNKVVDILNDNNVKSEADIEFLECNIEKIELRIEARVNFYKWVIGVFWGLYILLLNFQLRVFSLSEKTFDEEFLRSNFEDFLYVMVFTVVSLVAMVSYKRASNMLIANLQYACIEQKFRNQAT